MGTTNLILIVYKKLIAIVIVFEMFFYLLYFGKFFGKYQRYEEKNAQLKIIVDNYNSEKINIILILGKKICFYY
jgi:hypothetical protein